MSSQNIHKMDRKELQSGQDIKAKMEFGLKKEMGLKLSALEIDELEQINIRIEARLNDKRKLLEAPFADLPPLPPALPDYRDWITVAKPSEKDFVSWCSDGKIDAVERYVEERKDQPSEIPLRRGLAAACQDGRAQVARYLLQKGAQLYGYAVECACRRSDLALFEVFIEHGWHPNQQVPSIGGNFGVALLHCTGNPQIVRFLLAHGADPNLGPFIPGCPDFGHTPPMDRRSGAALTAAARSHNMEVIDLLLEYGAKVEWAAMPLHRALSTPDRWPERRPVFIRFLELGADPNKPTPFRHGNMWDFGAPIQWAIGYENWDAVELLLRAGAITGPGNAFSHLAGGPMARVEAESKLEALQAIVNKENQEKSDSS
ncbi:ankyrin repeat-containing domain protein [Nemania abortiva]|nr:ankyrin repeat-containing domain protein [Nemania abortiva]